jgi:fluoride exporter
MGCAPMAMELAESRHRADGSCNGRCGLRGRWRCDRQRREPTRWTSRTGCSGRWLVRADGPAGTCRCAGVAGWRSPSVGWPVGTTRTGLSAVFHDGSVLPWGTLAANLAGALLLGYLLTRFLQAAPRTTLTIPLLCTGFLGSFTTFSMRSVETVQFVQQGRAGLAVAYAGGSVALGLTAAAAGIALAERRG